MWSFKSPSQLLHSLTEPQWFPRAAEETESSLKKLEAEEEEYREEMRLIAEASAPAQIGLSSSKNQSSEGAADITTDDDLPVTTRPRFWNRPRPTSTRQQDPHPHPATPSSSRMPPSADESLDLDTPASRRSEMSLSS